MSIPAPLRAAARAAYRDIYRASSLTFAGDGRVLKAFREKMRQDAVAGEAESDPKGYEARTSLTRELATVLRRNIVQAERVSEQDDTWKIRLTEHTELGSNDTIKSPPSLPRPGGRRARCCSDPPDRSADPHHPPEDSDNSAVHTLNYSTLKKIHKQRIIPELKESDLEESFVRGSGPGGQSINKTENNVQLLHKPTGLRVQCQETRSLQTNRMLARRKLVEKLDRIENPGLSKGEMARAKKKERERQRKKKSRRKQRLQDDVNVYQVA